MLAIQCAGDYEHELTAFKPSVDLIVSSIHAAITLITVMKFIFETL